MKNKSILKFKRLLREKKDFILVTHLNPDPDGLSCILTFGLMLKGLKKRVFPIIEKIPEKIKPLYGKELLILVEDFWPEFLDIPVIMLFDASNLERVHEKIRTKLPSKFNLIVFDHHQPELEKDQPLNEISFIDPSAPSTSVIVFDILKKLGVKISSEMANNLLTGLYFDTGCFKYENTGEKAFRVAQELCKLGANPSLIAKNLYEELSLREIELLKKILDRLEVFGNGLVFAISFLTFEDLQDLESQDLSNFANFLRSIEKVNVSVLIKEFEKNHVAVSLRSKAPIEVLPLARMFGGGGHKYASGFKVKIENLFDFIEKFKNILRGFYGETTRD